MSSSTMKSTRSWEFSAIPVALALLGLLAVILFAAAKGLWVWLAVGVTLLAGMVAFALVAMARPHHPRASATPSRPEGAAPPLHDGLHRVLVIADDACAPGDLGAALADHRDSGRTAVFVVAPALGSRTAQWTDDEHSYREATRHLEATLQALADLRVDAEGQIGSHDPLQAADDGLREFPADQIVFAVHPAGAANWLEDGVVEEARRRYSVPVKELTVARWGASAGQRG
jgi:hypothetical protein